MARTTAFTILCCLAFVVATAVPPRALAQEEDQGAGKTAPRTPPSTFDPREAPWHDDPNTPPQQDAKALEILKAGIKALGGEQAILGRKTIYIKRKVTNYDYPEPKEGTITLWFKRPDKLRKEVDYPDRHHVEVFDGGRAWFDAGSGAHLRGSVVTASILDGMKDLDMPVNYLDADLTYFNISQEIPGKLAHVVKVRKDGYTKELMFDVTTNLLEVSGEYENPWGAADRMTKFDRYRPVDGILIPYRVENWRSNRMISVTEILEITFNQPIDDALFAYPGEGSEGLRSAAKP